MKAILLQLASILGLSLVAGTAYNYYNLELSPNDRALDFLVKEGRYPFAQDCSKRQKSNPSPEPNPNPNPNPDPDPEPDPEPPRPLIDVERAFEEWELESLFVDARRSRDYEEEHVPGAVSIPAREAGLEARLERLLESNPNMAAPVVCYCTGSDDCEDSHLVAEQLEAVGFSNLLVSTGGVPAWKAAGHPVATGKEPGRRTQ